MTNHISVSTENKLISLLDPLKPIAQSNWRGRIVQNFNRVVILFKTGKWATDKQVIANLGKELSSFIKKDKNLKEGSLNKKDSLNNEVKLRTEFNNRLLLMKDVMIKANVLTEDQPILYRFKIKHLEKQFNEAYNENNDRLEKMKEYKKTYPTENRVSKFEEQQQFLAAAADLQKTLKQKKAKKQEELDKKNATDLQTTSKNLKKEKEEVPQQETQKITSGVTKKHLPLAERRALRKQHNKLKKQNPKL